MESFEGRQADHVFAAQRRLNFRWKTPFSAEDVAYTINQLMDPSLHSPTGDAFRSGPGNVETRDHFSDADFDYLPRACGRTRSTV